MSYLTLSQKDINKLNEFKVGEKYTLQIEVELTTLRQGPSYDTVEPSIPGREGEMIMGEFDIESVVEVKKDGKKIPFKKMYAAAREGKIVED
jgi:hypothetical protein